MKTKKMLFVSILVIATLMTIGMAGEIRNKAITNEFNDSLSKSISGYSSIFGMTDKKYYSIPVDWGYHEVTNYTFTLPVDAYVYVESSGVSSYGISNSNIALPFEAGTQILLVVDNNSDDSSTRTYSKDFSDTYGSGGFESYETSGMYYLSKGSHTVHLYGLKSCSNSIGNCDSYLSAWFGPTNIIVNINQNGLLEVKQ